MACTDNVMRALFLLALFCVMHGEKEESKRIDAKASGPGGSFDITKLGASGNGKIDNTKAVQEAWASACGDTGKQTILIPSRTSPAPPPPRRPSACSALPRSHAPA
ncbi:Pectin lyase-like superfamily protein [Zea mays]|uniref:Pectin lyase-like superfamily protein n=1 Tax=Zea mays TaxID=4577 RepID=A0A1D6LRN6_MAIZE|nr:Pectin lyase-like superfamily protein [Zea mays]